MQYSKSVVQMRFSKKAILALGAWVTLMGGVGAQETPQVTQSSPTVLSQALSEADQLIKLGKPGEAYALLEPLEFERSGDVRFDYLLGIAALDSGKPDKATLALERVLAVDPNFAGARLDLARAYYQLGDLPRAKTEFDAVLTQDPPEAARVSIQKYLTAIAAFDQAKLTQVSGYAEAVLGHDSNIAGSSAEAFTFAPNSPWNGLLPGNTLPGATPLTGSYEAINAGLDISHSLNAAWRVFGGIDLRQHGNQTWTDYNSHSLDSRVGLSYGLEKNNYRLSLTSGQTYSASTMRRDSLGFNAEWQHTYSPANQVSVFFQYGQNRSSGFPATSPATDARIEGDTDQTLLGSGWVHVFADGKKVVFGSIFVGTERDVAPVITAGLPNGGRTDGQKNFHGLRLGSQMALNDRLDGVASLGWQSANYDKINNLIMDQRSETQFDLTLGLAWHIDKWWTLKPQVAFSRKNSNISLYSSDRTDVSVTLRRDFK